MRSSFTVLALAVLIQTARAEEPLLSAAVVVEETVATYVSPDNGAGPLWCYGSSVVYRDGDAVYASVMETGRGIPPLCNTRWNLYAKAGDGVWERVAHAEEFRLREPSPLVGFPGGPLLLSITPSIEPAGTHYGRCATRLLAFDPPLAGAAPKIEDPVWAGEPTFTDHSYRGVAADARNREVLWMNIDAKTGVQHVSLRDSEGAWTPAGSVEFPIRSCYPQTALKDGAAHVMAIGDIVEPVEEWRAFKHELTGREWDYVFRRLFYTWSPKIRERPLSTPLEVDTVESTAGHIRNLDLWIGPEGEAHLLYTKNTIHYPAMRDRYFPGVPIVRSLEYVVVREGKVARRETLLAGGERAGAATPHFARFHETPDGRLWAIHTASVRAETGAAETGMYLMQVYPDLERDRPIPVAVKEPFGDFMTAEVRTGNLPSWDLDLFGNTSRSNTLSYARVRLGP